jgi:hypothetical protein
MTVKIFIGCPSNNEDIESQAVLDFSLHKHASEPLDITWMKLSRDPKSFWYSNPKKGLGWKTRHWATPFSPFRWAIPEYCEFQGRAIYLDIDMMVMDDIAKFWNQDIAPEAFIVAKNPKTFCCSLFDCAKARKFLPPVSRLRSEIGLYGTMLRKNFGPGSVQGFNGIGNWNCLDGESYKDLHDPEIKIIHCTSIPTQPQLKHALPRLAAKGQKHWYAGMTRPHWRKDIVELFDGLLEEAKANGYPPEKYETAETFGDYGR